MNGNILDLNSCVYPCRVFLTVPPHEIMYINCILDSYEGIGLMRTADESAGKVVIYTTKEYKACVLELIEALNAEGVRMVVESVDYEDALN
jgi:hypothetical protein